MAWFSNIYSAVLVTVVLFFSEDSMSCIDWCVCLCCASAVVWCENVPVLCCQQPKRPAHCTSHCGNDGS